MPSLDIQRRPQKAILWRKTGTDRSGEPTLGTAETIRLGIEWTDRRANSTTATGRDIIARAVVAEEYPMGSRLWVVPLDAGQDAWDDPVDYYSGTGSGGDDTALLEITGYEPGHSLDIRHQRRVATLSWVGGGGGD